MNQLSKSVGAGNPHATFCGNRGRATASGDPVPGVKIPRPTHPAVSTNLARLRGRAPRGVRVIGAVPLGSWETITFVAALRHNKMTAPMVIEGAMTGEMFLAYVEQCLVPTLRRNDIVVMDNCRVHMAPAVRHAIERAKASVRYLPKYSPDLNPIELPYSKFKAYLRKVAARTVPHLTRAIRSFIPQLSPRECTNYFAHAGYASK
ncbi:IS630 family transposase [Bradyrhizobium sp. USDA 10063]